MLETKYDEKDEAWVVLHDGKEVFRWYDSVQQDSPEDLIWGREISAVFFAGVAVGKKMKE